MSMSLPLPVLLFLGLVWLDSRGRRTIIILLPTYLFAALAVIRLFEIGSSPPDVALVQLCIHWVVVFRIDGFSVYRNEDSFFLGTVFQIRAIAYNSIAWLALTQALLPTPNSSSSTFVHALCRYNLLLTSAKVSDLFVGIGFILIFVNLFLGNHFGDRPYLHLLLNFKLVELILRKTSYSQFRS